MAQKVHNSNIILILGAEHFAVDKKCVKIYINHCFIRVLNVRVYLTLDVTSKVFISTKSKVFISIKRKGIYFYKKGKEKTQYLKLSG